MIDEKIIPVEGINTELSPLYLGNQKARLIKNLDIALLNKGEGGNVLVLKPLSSTELYDAELQLPAGQNISCGGGVSHEKNEAYCFNWNANGKFHIYRIKNGQAQIIFLDPVLNFKLDPQFFISPTGRLVVKKVCVGGEERTYMYWTNGDGRQRFLCVEDSIATNFFTVPFFAGADRDDLISLGVPTPEDCIKITSVSSGGNGNNFIKEGVHRFRVLFIDRYGRPTEHGIISDQYFSKDCMSSVVNCLDIDFAIGGPFVEWIQIEKEKGTEWDIVEILPKYKSCDRKWYERDINPDLNYNTETKRARWRYCGGKDCIPVPDKETQRIENPMPITSGVLFSLGGSIALADNKYGFKPWDCHLKDKIKFEVEKPAPDPITNNEVRNIVVWMSVWNPFDNKWEGLWKKGERIAFGGLGANNQEEPDLVPRYGQIFGDPEQEGFIGYLAGTKYAAISEQWIYDSDLGEFKKHGIAADADEIRNNVWLQRFEFKNVPVNKYRFRVAGHEAKLTNPAYQSTSTYIAGLGKATSGLDLNNDIVDDSRELFIDLCGGDYDSRKSARMMVLYDLTVPRTDISLENRSRVVKGYVYETKDADIGSIPIEGADIVVSTAGANRRVYTTDHNGFYFVAAKERRYNTYTYVRRKCEWVYIERIEGGTPHGVREKNLYATDKWPDFLKEKCNRVLARGKIVDCDSGNGIPGITVGLTNGGTTLTRDDGTYDLVIHDKKDARKERLIFMGVNKCQVTTCDGSRCLPAREYIQPPCTSCTDRIVNIANYILRVPLSGETGLQKMGRYGFSLTPSDWMGRQAYAQTDPRWMLDIPNENQTKSFKYSRIKCTIDGTARFPAGTRKLHLRFSKNLAFDELLTWVVDRFEFIDNTGLVNTVSPTQIKVYYESLNEFNKQNAYGTNVNWQFIDARNSLPFQDIVHFVANGDGVIFDKTITALVKYDKEGKFFLIDYTSDLATLKEGAYIKLMRPAECVEAHVYYELCKTINVDDSGKPAETVFYLDAVDSYQHNRQIPTPVTTKKIVKKIIQNSNPIVYEEVEEATTTNVIKPYTWSFEHDSPSDLWGTKATNRGRPNTKNPYEDVICKPTEVALSGGLGVNSIINYHHYFDDTAKTKFSEEYGSIIAAMVQNNKILFVCSNDHFIVIFDDNSIRFDKTGKAFQVSADNQFSKPREKGGDTTAYGCLKDDRNTVSYLDGIVAWFSTVQSALIKHDFNQAVNLSKGICSQDLSAKARFIQTYNRDAKLKRYWHGQINPVDFNYYLTDFNLGNRTYINDAPEITRKDSDTFCFDLEAKTFRKTCSFTPELYLWLENDDREKQFFAIKEGVAHSFYREVNTVFNKFFGVQCNHALRVVMASQVKVEQYASIDTIVDLVKMYALKVTTETRQVSRIGRNWFQRGENFWRAHFLCDLNTIVDPNIPGTSKPIFGGEKLRGRWIDVLLVGDPDNLGKYFELTAVIMRAIPIEPTGEKGK